jgi:hypothetical protein
LAFILALLNAGSNIAARMAMMAITTSNSIKVKPPPFRPLPDFGEQTRGDKGEFVFMLTVQVRGIACI